MPRIASRHWKLEDAGKILPFEALDGIWPRRHLDFGLLASGSVKEYISVI